MTAATPEKRGELSAVLRSAGLGKNDVGGWIATEPAGVAGIDSDRRRYAEYWRLASGLIARLPKRPPATQANWPPRKLFTDALAPLACASFARMLRRFIRN